jgi:X-X-X-Leu-X-X-Gly heptad repeat protein
MAPKGMKERTGVTKQSVQPTNQAEPLSEESERLASAIEQLAMGQLADTSDQLIGESVPSTNGSAHVTSGSEQHTNGSEQHTNGSERRANGTAQRTNGSGRRINVSGQRANFSEQVANGSEHINNGSEQIANGSEQATNGSEQIANGSEQVTNGSEQASDWSEPIAKVTGHLTKGTDQVTKESEQLTTEFFQSINDALAPRQTLPGFADPRVERVNSIELPPWFIDRCRRAYLSIPFDADAECRVLGVTSASAGEGKTSVAIGVATAMAVDSKKPTLLLECDFADPSFFKFFGIHVEGGLSEWLDGGSRLRIVRGAAFVPNVFVIPSGTAQSEPARYFYDLIDRRVLDGLRACFSNIVIDLPPTLNISYGSLAFALADRLLIVARSRVTQTGDLERLVGLIGKDRVSGIVLNGTDYRTPRWLRPLL